MFIDDVTIRIRGGNGGRGAVAFNKNLNQAGPAGGSGGKGGSIYFEGSSDLGALKKYKTAKEFVGENGQNGRPQFLDGSDGEDLILPVPVGTIIHNLTRGWDREVVSVGERVRAAGGGFGGRGNFYFRSPTNTRPKEFQPGTEGEHADIHLELKMIADVGLIGLPNVGKSSLINELTRAQSKVANYHFTTLEAHLGTYYDLILADIPGLIEGASTGKGLGIKFLRHIERTNTLFHIISAESENPVKDYTTIRKELGAHNKLLLKKKEYVFVSKSDMVSPAVLKKHLAALKKKGITAKIFSIHDFDSIEKIKKILNTMIEKKNGKSK